MKTAMQELIEIINDPMRPKAISTNEIVFWLKNTGLEKEKEQLLKAFRDDSWNKSFIEYYNKKYQNK